jgi:antitoxin component YwqK of YwqJK toxin-antitoxin module
MKLALILIGLIGSALFFTGTLPGVSCTQSASSEPQVSYYGNGQKKTVCEFVDGKKTGHCEQWYSDGKPESAGEYADGQREGRWQFWREDGTLDAARSGLYQAGKRVGD